MNHLILLTLFHPFTSFELTNIEKIDEDLNPDQEQDHHITLKLNTRITVCILKTPTKFSFDPRNSLVIVLTDETFIQTDRNVKMLSCVLGHIGHTCISMRIDYYYYFFSLTYFVMEMK